MVVFNTTFKCSSGHVSKSRTMDMQKCYSFMFYLIVCFAIIESNFTHTKVIFHKQSCLLYFKLQMVIISGVFKFSTVSNFSSMGCLYFTLIFNNESYVDFLIWMSSKQRIRTHTINMPLCARTRLESPPILHVIYFSNHTIAPNASYSIHYTRVLVNLVKIYAFVLRKWPCNIPRILPNL